MVDGVLFAQPPAFNSGTITTQTTISGGPFVNGPTFSAGTVFIEQFITGVLFIKPPAFTAGSLALTTTLIGVLFTPGKKFPDRNHHHNRHDHRCPIHQRTCVHTGNAHLPIPGFAGQHSAQTTIVHHGNRRRADNTDWWTQRPRRRYSQNAPDGDPCQQWEKSDSRERGPNSHNHNTSTRTVVTYPYGPIH